MLPTETREPVELGAGPVAAAADVRPAEEPAPSTVGRALFFPRCLWCGTPAYRRSFCRACGSMDFGRERGTGRGVIVRRNGPPQHNTWFVAMDEGFNLLCQVTGTAPVVVAVGARVTVVRAVAPLGQGSPLSNSPPPKRR